MGVPAFFRWLTGHKKYPSIIVYCVEEKAKDVNGVKIPVDSSKPNPNDIEFDNLYLDMNGIIHPCCHPEDKPAPKNEDEMMVLIFEYIDRIFSIVRPRKLLYMAIDGVAPRAKMNQQRSRRFRASKEASEKSVEMAEVREELLSKGFNVPPEKKAEEKFDSNCITPGTPFMFHLADCLRYYVHDRLNNDPGWQGIKIILSDANVPGEGEHKIMDYIRRQRAQPDHDPNTHHCLCGADADLIMLGLATHEPNFTIIREEFTPNKPKPCELCGQIGHELKECQGLPKEQETVEKIMGEETQFIFLRLNILREYLERELMMTGLPFKYCFERALDDWVLMCFFVGNDFLPHLPSLEIREGAIDRLQTLYKDTVRKTGGYLSDCGVINLSRVQLVLTELGKVEDEIFKKRRQTELDFRRRDKQKKQRMANQMNRPRFIPGGQFAPQKIGDKPPPLMNVKQTAADMRMNKGPDRQGGGIPSLMGNSERHGEKRKSEAAEEEEEEEPADDVKLWEDGWKDRYYQSKFSVDPDDIEFRHTVANHYVRGLCWVLRYYYQGCASWKWYFPYHYAPFASDFVNIGDLDNDFERGTEPFKPLEQLMGVFPAASKQHLPVTWRELMTSSESPIIDFYPTDFRIDLNGKKYAWQGVALLPFVDEKRLLSALSTVYPDLTPGEKKRNTKGNDRLFVSSRHSSYDFLEGLYEGNETSSPLDIDTKITDGMLGSVWCDEYCIESGGTFKSPLPQCPDIKNSYVMTIKFKDPQYPPDHLFKADTLPGAKFPEKVLKPEDFGSGRFRPQLGFQKFSGYRNTDVTAANRMIRGAQGFGAAIPPPQSLKGRGQNHGGGYRGGYGGGRPDRNYQSFGQGGGNQGWNRNMQSQSSAYQRNQYAGQRSNDQSYQRSHQQSYGGQSHYGNQSSSRPQQSGQQFAGDRRKHQYGGDYYDEQSSYGARNQSQGQRGGYQSQQNQRYRPY